MVAEQEKIALRNELEKKNIAWEYQLSRCKSQIETIAKLKTEKDFQENSANVTRAQKVAATITLQQNEKKLKKANLVIKKMNEDIQV